MELLLKCQGAYLTESVTRHDYKPHSAPVSAKPISLHHKPSSLASAASHVKEPPTTRKDIVREPVTRLPSFGAEMTALSGGRYQIRPYRPSSAVGTTAQEWDKRSDKARFERAKSAKVDIGRDVSIAFNRTLPRFLTD